MNTHSRSEEFKNFRIILNRESISTIAISNPKSKLKSKETAETMWETQSEKSTTSKKVTVDFCLPRFSAKNIVTWKWHVDESTNGRYDMILGRDLFTALGLDLKFSDNVILGGRGPYEGSSVPMVDVSNYYFVSITDKTFKPKESFINSYVDKCLESYCAIISMCRMRIIIYAKF